MHQHEVTFLADCDDVNDAFYLAFTPLQVRIPVARSVRVTDDVFVDLDAAGGLLGIELLGAARSAILRHGVVAAEHPR